MRRREFIALIGSSAAAWPSSLSAQRIPAIGYLGPTTIAGHAEAFLAGLRELGYEDRRNIRIEARWANGTFDLLPALAAELVDLKVDVLVASLTQAALAAKNATMTVPIVIAGVGDPVAAGLIVSLARPGGNVTGTSGLQVDIVGKQLELLKEIVPGIARFAVLWNPANPVFQELQLRQAALAAQAAGIQLQLLEARKPDDFDAAFTRIAEENTRALVVLGDPLFSLHGDAIARRALANRLPTVSSNRTMAERGILSIYGPSLFHSHKRAAVYVDKILKGAKPADLPVEQPTTFELIINLKTAKAIGLTVPPSLLARADEVIE
jgi:putative tryptophan/tyrosine transport system substrate-binding protein